MGPALTPRMLPPQPHWNAATITPYAAPIDNRFMKTAFSGTNTERKTSMSSRKLRTRTAPMKIGRRSPITSEKSIALAV
jgi:hypothetical protein